MPDLDQAEAGPHEGPGPDFTLGDWLVQPCLNRASRNGTTIHLRPQLVDVLVCLARAAGHPVTRHELLDRVWPNQFVADTALARCIAELRQALGDNAQAPSVIETIPKRGYRLIAPVAPVNGNGNGNGHGAVAYNLHGEPEAAPAPIEHPLPVDASPDIPHAALADTSLPGLADRLVPDIRSTAVPATVARDLGPAKSRARRLAVAGLVVAAAAVALVSWVFFRPAPVKPPLSERDPVVLSFTNATGDPVFDGTLRLALAIHLEQSPYVRVAPERTVQETLQFLGQPGATVITPDLALQICERIGASAILHGSIAPLGQRYVLGLEAVACASRDTIARAQAEAAGKEHVLEALSRAANTMRRDLGESLASIARFDVPLVRATTPSLEALRAVSLGDRERYRGAYREALQNYQRATTIDPDFALAYARTGVAFMNLRRRGEAIVPLTRAFELSGRVTEHERLYIAGHYYNGVLESPLRAIDAFSVLSQSHQDPMSARLTLGSLYQQIGLWYQAVDEAREAVRLEPDNAIAQAVLAGALTGAGGFGEALDVLAEAGRLGLLSPSSHDVRFDLGFLTGNDAIMREENAYAAGEPAMTPFLLVRRARMAMYRGRFSEARDLWAEVRTDADARQDVTTASMALLSEAGSRALLGDRTGTSNAVRMALEIDRSPSRIAQSALVMALAGDVSGSRRHLAEYDGLVNPGSGRDLEFVAPARAALAVAQGRFGDVAALLEPVKPYELGWRFEYLPSFIRAHALLGLQEHEQAVEAFQVILDNRGVMPYSVFDPLARLGQARAYAAQGQVDQSLRGYEAFLALWQDADAGLALVQAARREAAALRGR